MQILLCCCQFVKTANLCYNFINKSYKDGNRLKHLFAFFKKYKWQSILAPLFKMLEATFDLLVPLVVADIIDVGITSGDTKYILVRFGVLVAMAVLGLVCSFTAQFFSAQAASGTSAGLRKKLLARIQGLNFSDLDNVGTSTLITRMTSDVNQVQNGVNMFLRLFLRSPFIVFGAMIMAFSINVEVASVFAIVIPVLFVIVFGIMKLTNPLYKRLQKQVDRTTVTTRENLSGVRVVRAFGKEKEETARFEGESQSLTNTQLKVGNLSALTNPLTYVVINLGIVAILWLGAQRVDGGVLLSGDVIALVNYLSQVLIELVKLANLIVLLGKSVISMNRIGQILDVTPSMTYGEKTQLPDTDEAIVLDNVCLRYTQNADNALDNISCAIKRGQTVGIIGSTGSSKTTLVSLIPRLYDIVEGSIKVGGIDVKDYDLDTLRNSVAMVLQKNVLFSGTVRENMQWGNQTASDEEILHALKLAQIDVDLDKFVEQGGVNCSGGQKQRLSIARVFLKNPPILILDEATSALDTATELKIQKAFDELSKGRTTIIIAHRLSTVKNADCIAVIGDKEIKELGTHNELILQNGIYAKLHNTKTE